MKNGSKTRFLIVKTSSLGDIIQSFDVLNYLHQRFPQASIDWVVEERFASIVAAHPFINRVIAFDIRKIKSAWREKKNWKSLLDSIRSMRQSRYDLLFDLQGNCKSGFVTLLCHSDIKVGFGKKCVREWPNVLATHQRFEISRSMNIRQQYVSLVQKFFNDQSFIELKGIRLRIDEKEIGRLQSLFSLPLFHGKKRVMICPGSKWSNKQLAQDTLEGFLDKIENALSCSFLLIWGNEEERKCCLSIHRRFSHCSIVVDRLELPVWQNLMCEVDLVVAVDSSALHLCATTSTPSFSIFGPTSPDVFKPSGTHHFAYQGVCPYKKIFEKQCPDLRSCSTGGCIRDISADQLIDSFWNWWNLL
jgi:heptosyltransferase I